MALLVPIAGENIILDYLTNNGAPQNLVLRLYSSNTTPADSDTAATYTEATFTGYSAVTLTAGTWGASSNGTKTYGSAVTFTSTADAQNQDIYGYYVTRATGGELLWSERFTDGPYNIANNGDEISVTPSISVE
jgi:hypothetical protein